MSKVSSVAMGCNSLFDSLYVFLLDQFETWFMKSFGADWHAAKNVKKHVAICSKDQVSNALLGVSLTARRNSHPATWWSLVTVFRRALSHILRVWVS